MNQPETEALRAAAREAAEQAFEKQAHPTLMGKPYSIARLWYTTGYLDAEEAVRADERTKVALDSASRARIEATGPTCMCRHPQSSHALRVFGDIVPLPHCDECCEVDETGDRFHDKCFDCAGWRASSGQTSEDQSTSQEAL